MKKFIHNAKPIPILSLALAFFAFVCIVGFHFFYSFSSYQTFENNEFSILVPRNYSINKTGLESTQIVEFFLNSDKVGGIDEYSIPNITELSRDSFVYDLSFEDFNSYFSSIILNYGKGDYTGYNFSNGKVANFNLTTYFQNNNISHNLFICDDDVVYDIWFDEYIVGSGIVERSIKSFALC